MTEIIKVVGPDCIILEDIDHLGHEEIVDLLDKIEDFNHENKLVFATANRVSRLDNALLRPGRFDEAIEIKNIDEEVLLKLVQGDSEIFEIVKNFPVAFAVELMKRVKILGKEEALQNIQDLQDRVDNFSLVNYELKAKSAVEQDVVKTKKQAKVGAKVTSGWRPYDKTIETSEKRGFR
jgi:SpoVK/Ycf46/Vps4 family AAA+-type ATPase